MKEPVFLVNTDFKVNAEVARRSVEIARAVCLRRRRMENPASWGPREYKLEAALAGKDLTTPKGRDAAALAVVEAVDGPQRRVDALKVHRVAVAIGKHRAEEAQGAIGGSLVMRLSEMLKR